MAGNVYYKIPPEWAKKINVTQRAVVHPDGWYMILPPMALKLARSLAPRSDGRERTPEEAVLEIGGVVYNHDELMASQRVEEGYMMNLRSEETPEGVAAEDGI